MKHPTAKEISASSLPPHEAAVLKELSARLSGWKKRDFVAELTAAALRRRSALRAAASSPESPTFENTCLTLEMQDLELDAISSDFNSLLSALRHPRLVSAEEKMVSILAAEEVEDMSDNRLALRLRRLRLSPSSRLPAAQKKLVSDHYKGFLRAGYYLPKGSRVKLARLSTRLAKLESSYSRAASKERKHVLVRSRSQLAGLTPQQVAEFRSAARNLGKNGWAIPLDPTQHQPITASLKVASLRLRIHKISMSRGRLTSPIAAKILDTRKKIAKILGYKDWAACKLSESFAGSSSRVWSSLRTLARQARPLAQRDLALAASRGWSSATSTSLCPLSFLPATEDSYRGFDPVAVLERGCFETARRLFGLGFQRVSGQRLYHPEVLLYRVTEGSGAPLGFVTFDPWIRRGKEDGAWASQWLTPPGSLPASGIFMNAPRSGCSFSDAKTVFHEFGHALHALFSFGQFPSHWGLEMPSDFAEIPSQLAETWAEYPEIYRLFAPPSAPPLKDLAPLSPAPGSGLRQAALLVSSASDMLMHSCPARTPSLESVDSRAASLVGLGKVRCAPRYKAGYFEHVFAAGYDAAYYSYLWTESRAKSLAARSLDWGGLCLRAGSVLRENLLAPGGALCPSQVAKMTHGR